MNKSTVPNLSLDNAAAEVAAVGRLLAHAFSQVISALPGSPAGPQRLAEALDVDKGLASRLLKAVNSRDPIAVAHLIPGHDPLRRVLSTARKRGVPAEVVRGAEAALSRFSALVRTLAKDRATFDGIVSRWLPEARGRFDGRVKQQLYRGYSQLRGFSVDVELSANFIHPSPQPGYLDYATVSGLFGLRRFRPDATVRIASRVVRNAREPWSLMTLDGTALEDAAAGRLDRFCTAPPAELRVEEFGDAVYCCLASGHYGPDSAVDLVLGHTCRLAARVFARPGERRLAGTGVEVDKPTKLLHFDTFVHDAVYAGSEPELLIFDTAFRGAANMNDPCRIPDRLELGESVQYLGRGFAGVRASHIPNYVEMLEYVVNRRGWNPDELRGYRVLIAHPIYGSQVTLGFECPQEPEARSAPEP